MGKAFLDRVQGSSRTDSTDEKTVTKSDFQVGSPGDNKWAAPSDKAEISPNAHRLIALRHAVDSGREALQGVPAVRPDRVAEVRARLDRGFYNSVEVRTLVAERLDGVARNLEDL